ncbi:unnamed protein product [Parascedosporium putredinis]|uniref:Nuclear architecture-related protein 1 n=1 Tax=Parascedosporium putredinis TaxID=1442378 RepID=A0A9P1H6N6_9PEZI|nr:unnamed protein product [Parascedosporium putredinis]CAI7997850.1 unnamed protein product [Parascedosporium putredinis]
MKSAGLEHEVVLDGTSRAANASGPAQISLTDCLACSGCVTSAEAVLVSLQSHAEVLNTLDAAPALRIRSDGAGATAAAEGLEDDAAKIFVASVAPQVRANLAAACGPGWGNSFAWVVDTNVAREACLVLSAEEALASAGPGSPPKPVLASACPGWVCYAEKTHPTSCPTYPRSNPPGAHGHRRENRAEQEARRAAQPDMAPGRHALLRQEARSESRRAHGQGVGDAGDDAASKGARDVDCVITSKEVLMLAESRGLNFFDLADDEAYTPQTTTTPFPDPALHEFLFPRRPYRSPREASTSGGYLHFILEAVASRNPGSQIQGARGRNADVMEYSVVSAAGDPIFRAARFYGFRNIQNLVRKLKPPKPSRMPGGKPFGSARRPAAGKPGTVEYAYVEVMACPGGCTNGGGQVKVDDDIIAGRTGQEAKPGPHEQKAWLARIDEAYFSEEDDVDGINGAPGTGVDGDVVDGISLSHIKGILEYWSGATGVGLDKLALTSFREVISDVGKDKTQTERAAQLAGKIGGGW